MEGEKFKWWRLEVSVQALEPSASLNLGELRKVGPPPITVRILPVSLLRRLGSKRFRVTSQVIKGVSVSPPVQGWCWARGAPARQPRLLTSSHRFHYAARIWDGVKKSSALAEYSRLLA